jgi:hypothetical protein
MSRDDRDRPGDLDLEAPATPAEQARAEAFGRHLDSLAAGEPLPPAMDSDDRALLETATMVLASNHSVELGRDRTRRLVDQALEAAVLGRQMEPNGVVAGGRVAPLRRPRAGTAQVSAGDGDRAAESSTDLVRARRRRADRVIRNVPWAVASLAAAAAVVLFVTRSPDTPLNETAAPAPVRLDIANTSRPADPLVGIIARGDAGRASERVDLVFADRMNGYRDLMLRRALSKGQP